MGTGQAVLAGTLDVGAVDVLESRLVEGEQARSAAHARSLQDALELLRLYDRAGMWLAVPSQLALLWRCSETAATSRLTCAQVLADLPGAFELLSEAVMTVEQSMAVGRVLDPLPQEVREAVWRRASLRLRQDAERGSVCPPARLTELLRRWAIEVDPESAVERRRRAEARGSVLLQRRDDGLCDVVLSGLTAPVADAVLSRVTVLAERSAFPGDERTAGRRRLDAAVDLLLARTGRPAGECAPVGGLVPLGAGTPGTTVAPEAGTCSRGCGCPLGSPVPCGAHVTVLVPLATALGHGDVPAEQAGAGPMDPELLALLLGSAPLLRAVWVDPDGTPVTALSRPQRPARGDAEGVREALRRLVAEGPGTRQPRHPDDHDGHAEHDLRTPARRRPRVLDRPHPPDTPGPYRVPAALRRLLGVRAPRCEWPGCGVRAARCDVDHDVAHPHGPTCACNLGPLCRRHHQVKQLGWLKQRTPDGVSWTSPTLRTTLSPPQTLPVPPVHDRTRRQLDPREQLSPAELEDALHPTDPHFDRRDQPGTGDWVLAARDAERRWWLGQLHGLRADASS